MFSSLKSKLLLGVYIFITLSIPVGAYLVSQQQILGSHAQEPKATKQAKESTKSASLSANKLQTLTEQLNQDGNPSPTTEPSVTSATSFGPTLSLKTILEGRPKDNQATKLFVGILEGNLTINPKFLLSFTIDLPASGEYSGLSLAGLTSGTKYTALLKGSAQIATSSAYILSPSVSNLNSGEPLTMLSGDLNDDNTINSSDYSVSQKALGSNSKSSNWNENADLNKDGVVNLFDLSIIQKNLGQIGASGSWTSSLPKSATPSASLTQPIGSSQGSAGYWIWIPH